MIPHRGVFEEYYAVHVYSTGTCTVSVITCTKLSKSKLNTVADNLADNECVNVIYYTIQNPRSPNGMKYYLQPRELQPFTTIRIFNMSDIQLSQSSVQIILNHLINYLLCYVIY